MVRDKDVWALINLGIELSRNFRIEFKNNSERLDSFLNLLDDMINILSDKESVFEDYELQKIQKVYLQGNGSSGCKYTETLVARDLIWARKVLAQMILYNSSYWRDSLKKEDADIDEQQKENPYDDSPIYGIWSDMDELITKGTMIQIGKKQADYYKNFMNNNDQKEFETMMDFIKFELIHYSTNLAYLNKIVPVLEECLRSIMIKDIFQQRQYF